jgi:hypothetical protein
MWCYFAVPVGQRPTKKCGNRLIQNRMQNDFVLSDTFLVSFAPFTIQTVTLWNGCQSLSGAQIGGR